MNGTDNLYEVISWNIQNLNIIVIMALTTTVCLGKVQYLLGEIEVQNENF